MAASRNIKGVPRKTVVVSSKKKSDENEYTCIGLYNYCHGWLAFLKVSTNLIMPILWNVPKLDIGKKYSVMKW